MNPFDEIESYIIARVQAVDPEIEHFEDPFGLIDLTQVQTERFFKFWFTTTGFARSGNEDVEEINSVLELYAQRSRDVNQSFKDLYCKMLDVVYEITNPTNAKAQVFMTDVFATLAEPVPLETDDNTIKLVLNLTIRRDIRF